MLERRLLTRDSALVTSSVSKCALRVQHFLASLQSSETTDAEIATLKHGLVRELALYRIEMSQALEAAMMCDRELEESKAIEKSIEEDIKAAQIDISNLAKELSEQQSIRKHKEECELLARLVNTLPPRSTVMKDIVKAEDALAKLREQSNTAEHRVNMRTKQFQLLLQSIFDMKKNMEEDSEQQELLAILETTAAPEEDEPAALESDGEDNADDNGGRRGRNDDDAPAQKRSRTDTDNAPEVFDEADPETLQENVEKSLDPADSNNTSGSLRENSTETGQTMDLAE